MMYIVSMAHWTCDQCGKGFERPRCGERPIRFCNQICYHVWQRSNGNAGRFRSGFIPWNKNLKGIHLSPASEFKKGCVSLRKMPLGSVRIRLRKRGGKKRAWVKVDEPNVWQPRCRVVWEKAYGKIPKGLVLHHADRDTLNDSLNNLSAISRAAHMKEHKPEFEDKRREGLKRSRRRRR